MNILFFLPNIKSYKDRVDLLCEISNHVELFTLMVGTIDSKIDTSKYKNIRIVEIGFRKGKKLRNIYKANRLAKQIISNNNINIVHDTFGTFLPLFYKKKRYPQVRFVTSLFILNGYRLRHIFNQVNLLKLLSNRSTAVMFLNQRIEKQICKLADYVVLQAPGLVDHLLEYVPIPRTKVHVITNNVDTDFWYPGSKSLFKTCQDKPLKILFVGGVHFSKGIFTLIEVMRLLRQDRNSILTVVGSFSSLDRTKILQQIYHYGLQDAIKFVSKLNAKALRELYCNSDLFIYQTINDGSPRVVLEALSCELPLIASHHPGIDVIDPQEEFINFTRFGDAEKVAEFVKHFCQHPEIYKKRARRGRTAVIKKFSVGAVAQQYLNFYGSICKTWVWDR